MQVREACGYFTLTYITEQYDSFYRSMLFQLSAEDWGQHGYKQYKSFLCKNPIIDNLKAF